MQCKTDFDADLDPGQGSVVENDAVGQSAVLSKAAGDNVALTDDDGRLGSPKAVSETLSQATTTAGSSTAIAKENSKMEKVEAMPKSGVEMELIDLDLDADDDPGLQESTSKDCSLLGGNEDVVHELEQLERQMEQLEESEEVYEDANAGNEDASNDGMNDNDQDGEEDKDMEEEEDNQDADDGQEVDDGAEDGEGPEDGKEDDGEDNGEKEGSKKEESKNNEDDDDDFDPDSVITESAFWHVSQQQFKLFIHVNSVH